MNEKQILERIHALVDEEHELRTARKAGSSPDTDRLQHVEEALDQCWDLLRRRRAKQEFGEDPESAQVADVEQVEKYLQ